MKSKKNYSQLFGLFKKVIPSLSLFVILVLTSTNVSAQVICDKKGNLKIKESKLLKAFNKLSKQRAYDTGFTYNKKKRSHGLLFLLKDGSAVEFQLKQSGGGYELSEATGVKHTCSGNPCNECERSSTWLSSVSCTCKEADCSDCRCNHTVSDFTSGFTEELVTLLN